MSPYLAYVCFYDGDLKAFKAICPKDTIIVMLIMSEKSPK